MTEELGLGPMTHCKLTLLTEQIVIVSQFKRGKKMEKERERVCLAQTRLLFIE